MTYNQTSIGIDISKEFLDCHAMPTGKSKRFTNSPSGIKACIDWICKHSNIYRVVFEPTGGYERRLLKALQASNLPAARVNAFYIHNFRKAKNDQAKTDDIDAKILAHYGLVMTPDITPVRSPLIEELGELIHYRSCLKAQRAAESTRREKTTSQWCFDSINKNMAHLEKEIQAIEKEIKRLLKHPELKEKADILMQNKGISYITAASLLSKMPELGDLSREEAARLMGVAPMNRDSGKTYGQKHIRGGRKELRNTWYMATFTAVRHNKALKEFYNRLKANGKPHKVAMTAAMRKFIIWVNAQMNHYMNGQEIYIK